MSELQPRWRAERNKAGLNKLCYWCKKRSKGALGISLLKRAMFTYGTLNTKYIVSSLLFEEKESRAFSFHTSFPLIFVFLFGYPHLLKWTLKKENKFIGIFEQVEGNVQCWEISASLGKFETYERRQNGASYPRVEPSLHSSVIRDQLQSHALKPAIT